ncbi:MAG: metallophosphoesterase family protein [Myxococcaceae bacterium]
MRLLHCSDVHITQDYFSVPPWQLGWRRGLALLELSIGGRARKYAQAKQTLRQIANDVPTRGADHLIVTGDLTQYATEWEFQGAREALGEVAADKQRCTVIPGNHDRYTPGAVKHARLERYFGHLLESDLPQYRREGEYPFVRLLGEDVAVVGLSSARVPAVPGVSFGRVGEAQLEGLRALIDDPQVKPRAVLVLVHHAPRTASNRRDSKLHGLIDGEALLSLLPGPRFAVLHGHIHRRYHHPATSTSPHTFGAGSSTEKDHEGYWLIDVRDGKIQGGEVHRPGV